MKSKYFLDTCMFIKSFDKEAPKEMEIAKRLIKEALKSNKGIISYQVIQELLIEAMHNFKNPIKPLDSKVYISNFLFPICEVFPTVDLVKSAIDIVVETGLVFNKAIKVASAVQGNAKIFYTNDFGEIYELKGIKVINPFIE